MNGFLTVANKCLAYYDDAATNQPQQKAFDWGLSIKSASIADPRTFGGVLAAGSSVTVFDGTRATSVDGSTAFDSSLSSLDAGTRYRFTWTGGTNPTLRTDRSLASSGTNVAVSLNADSTVNITTDGSFGSTAVGDTVFIPGVSTGDSAGPFSDSNTGFWTVLAVISGTNLQLGRPAGTSFSATGETVALTDNAQLRAFSAAGVQVGDSVTISAGFAASARRTYIVNQVTSTWFEVLSTSAIPVESSKMPGATGIVFYTDAKSFLHLEVDQEAVVQFDGDTGEAVRLSPVQAGDRKQPGWLEKMGSCHKLVLVNKASVALNYVAHTAR